MAKRPKRILKLGPGGEVKLPPDVLQALELDPGGDVEIFLDTRRKQLRLERHVEDPWAEATRKKQEKGLEDLMADQKKRKADAAKLFDERTKEPPPKRRPEDDPGYWR